MRILIFLIFMCMASPLKATTQQFLDSVSKKLDTTKVITEKLNCLYTLSYEYGYINPTLGIRYGKECLKLAVAENSFFYQLCAYNGIANSFETLSEYDSAGFYHYKSYSVALFINSPEKIAITTANIAAVLKETGNYKKALQYFLIAASYYDKSKKVHPRIDCSIGELHFNLNNYAEAEQLALNGIEKCKESSLKYIGCSYKILLAKCYYYHYEKFDTAVYLLKQTLKELEQNTDILSLATCLNVLGEIYLHRKEYATAAHFFNQEFKLQKSLNNKNGIALCSVNIVYSAAKSGRVYPNKFMLFLEPLNRNLNTLKHNKHNLVAVYHKLAQAYEAIGEYSLAITFYKNYYKLRAEILSERDVAQMNELNAKYEVEKKETKIRFLEEYHKVKTAQLRNRNVSLVLLFVLLLTAIVFFFSRAQWQQSKSKIALQVVARETAEAERMRIARDLHDDLGSGLSKINFLSELVKKHAHNNPELSNVSSRISETSIRLADDMRELIWILNLPETTLGLLSTRVREYSSDFFEGSEVALALNLPLQSTDIKLSKELYRTLFMVVKESLNNILKHAKATKATICMEIRQNVLHLSIKDNGLGFEVNAAKRGNGLNNILNRVKVLGGNSSIVSQELSGTTVECFINLP